MGGLGSVFSEIFGTNSDVDTKNENPLGFQDYGSMVQGGINNYANAVGGQNQLAQQLQALANGQGPNPATSMLSAAQGQAAQQAAGQFSGNRALNPALAARLAGQLQGQAAGSAGNQAATMQAQQQIQAQQNLGGLYNQMANQGLGLYQTATNGYNNAAAINAGIASGNAQNDTSIIGGLMGGAGAAMGAKKAHGGMIGGNNGMYADGGMTAPSDSFGSSSSTPSSFAASFLKGFGDSNQQNGNGSGNAMVNGMSKFGEGMALSNGGPVRMNLQAGGHVPGVGAVKGDSFSNDTVPAVVSPGEIVIPRSVAMSKNAPAASAKFVAAVLARNNMGKK